MVLLGNRNGEASPEDPHLLKILKKKYKKKKLEKEKDLGHRDGEASTEDL